MKTSKFISKLFFKVRKNSPEIFIVTGIVGIVTSTVMACRATTKISEISEEAIETLEKIEKAVEQKREDYTEEDAKRDKSITYIQTGFKYVKLYAPSVFVGGLSIACILASHSIMHKRNLGLAAAYAAVDQSYKAYRNKVKERFGEEVDKIVQYGLTDEKIEEVVTDENGKEKKIKKKILVTDDKDLGPYARIFDESSRCWEDDAEYNLNFLIGVENAMTNKLIANRYLFLNEVYEALDIQPTKLGQTVGWVYDPHNPESPNCVDLGIFNVHRKKARDFVNGYEKCIIIDPNVEGDIMTRVWGD